MRILIDTHILLWWLADDRRLPNDARALVADPSNEIVVSAATVWEVVIKQALGTLKLDGDLISEVGKQGFSSLPVAFEHAAEVASLPPIHRDPFERMLVAQARVENLHLLTADTNIRQYPVNTL